MIFVSGNTRYMMIFVSGNTRYMTNVSVETPGM